MSWLIQDLLYSLQYLQGMHNWNKLAHPPFNWLLKNHLSQLYVTACLFLYTNKFSTNLAQRCVIYFSHVRGIKPTQVTVKLHNKAPVMCKRLCHWLAGLWLYTEHLLHIKCLISCWTVSVTFRFGLWNVAFAFSQLASFKLKATKLFTEAEGLTSSLLLIWSSYF